MDCVIFGYISLDVMDVENVKLVDGLIFGYLGRRQYHETLRAFCNEAPSLRDNRHRFENAGDVFIQVNDQLHDKNLEQIVNKAFARLLRSFRIISTKSCRLWNRTCETLRSGIFDDNRNVRGRTASQNGDQTVYQTANTHTSQPQQTVSQQDYAFDYHPQPHASTYIVPNSTSYAPVQVLSQDNTVTSAQDMPANNTISYLTSDQAMPATQPPTTCEQPMLIDYGVSVKDSHSDVNSSQCPRLMCFSPSSSHP
ncbi:LisH [Cooperia oncophora]